MPLFSDESGEEMPDSDPDPEADEATASEPETSTVFSF
jgi:hypothetical protein